MSNNPARKSNQTSTTGFDQFIGLLDRYAAYAKQAGKTIYRSPEAEALAVFTGLGQDRATWLLERLNNELTAIEKLIGAGEKLTSTSRLLWRFFQQTGFKPCGDIFDKIDDDHVVEVYATNHTHIWQSLNFFDWVSTSIEKVYTETWYNNSVRDPGLERDIGILATKLFGGEVQTTMEPGLPWHWIQEVDTVRMHKFELLLRYMSPIFMDGKVVGLITVNQCRSLTK
jgi:hypothetical protein